MLGLVAGTGWDILSSLQAQQLANAAPAAGGAGAGQFAAGVNGQNPGPNAWATATPPTGTATVGQSPLSPGVLGFLIWNQSQQSANMGNPVTGGTGSTTPTTVTPGAAATTGTDASDSFAWAPIPALLSQLSADASGNNPSPAGTAAGSSDGTTAGNSPADPLVTDGEVATDPSAPSASAPSAGAHGHHHHHGGFAGETPSGGANPLAAMFGTSADGSTSTTATNTDGSTTTTITYADGSEVTLTAPAQAASANPGATATAPAPSPNNFLETLIRLQAQALTPSAAA
jgi:hypothetical protein